MFVATYSGTHPTEAPTHAPTHTQPFRLGEAHTLSAEDFPSLFLSTFMLKALLAWEERVRTRIHSIRIPIKNKRTLLLVQCMYFISPVVLGGLLMQAILPDPEDMRKTITPPTAEEQQKIDAERTRLQEQFDEARRARATAGR